MTKGLHKNSLRKGEPNKWIVEDIIEQLKAEIERRIKSWSTRGENSPEGQGKDTCVSRVTELTDLLSFLSDLEKEEKPMNPQPVKELLTFDGFVDKVGSWFANLELRRFRKTFDGEIYPATELVQAYEWFVHELSEKYREKHLQEQPVELDEKTLLTEMANVYGTYTRPDYIEENTAEAGCDFECAIARHFYELGRQSKPKVSEGLKDVADTLAEEHGFVKKPDFKPAKYSWSAVRDVFIEGVLAGAEWQKEQMMKEAVEGEIINAGYPTKIELNTFYSKFEHGQEVKVIIIKEDTK